MSEVDLEAPRPLPPPPPAVAPVEEQPPLTLPPETLETGPLSPEEKPLILAEIAKAILEENRVVTDFEARVEQFKAPEVGKVFEDIAMEATASVRRLRDLQTAVQIEERIMSPEPADLNACFQKALGLKRSLRTIEERLTVDVDQARSINDEAAAQTAIRRARETLKAARNELRDSPCLFVRDKIFKLRTLDEAVLLIEAGSLEAAAEKVRGI